MLLRKLKELVSGKKETEHAHESATVAPQEWNPADQNSRYLAYLSTDKV